MNGSWMDLMHSFANDTHTILCFVTGTTFTLLEARFGPVLTQHLRQGAIVGVPLLLALVHHGGDGHASGTGRRRHPHHLDLRLGKIVRLRDSVDALIVELGERIAEQLEPPNTLRPGHDGLGAILGVRYQRKVAELLQFCVRPRTNDEHCNSEGEGGGRFVRVEHSFFARNSLSAAQMARFESSLSLVSSVVVVAVSSGLPLISRSVEVATEGGGGGEGGADINENRLPPPLLWLVELTRSDPATRPFDVRRSRCSLMFATETDIPEGCPALCCFADRAVPLPLVDDPTEPVRSAGNSSRPLTRISCFGSSGSTASGLAVTSSPASVRSPPPFTEGLLLGEDVRTFAPPANSSSLSTISTLRCFISGERPFETVARHAGESCSSSDSSLCRSVSITANCGSSVLRVLSPWADSPQFRQGTYTSDICMESVSDQRFRDPKQLQQPFFIVVVFAVVVPVLPVSTVGLFFDPPCSPSPPPAPLAT
uniref:Uncharacterized protein n=1 Tax=Anopheles atroparvus TaxID=41427 RepID=A0A182JCU8_ANOAO